MFTFISTSINFSSVDFPVQHEVRFVEDVPNQLPLEDFLFWKSDSLSRDAKSHKGNQKENYDITHGDDHLCSHLDVRAEEGMNGEIFQYLGYRLISQEHNEYLHVPENITAA